jgi:membrane fusion protein (multidrug efflux system)
VGEFVGREPNPVILNTVSEISSVIVKFNITESEFIGFSRRFSMATEAEREEREGERNVELELADGSIYAYPGKIDFIDRNIDVNTGSILVQASFDNPNSLLRPGLYSKVKIQTDLKKDAIIVPQRCIMETQGQFSAYVVNDSNKVETRQITVAYKAGDLAAITDGLKAGDKVVIDALQKVKSGMEVNPVASDFKSKVYKLKEE